MYTVTSIAVFFNGLDQRCVLHVDGPLSCRICLLSARKQHVGVIRRHRALLFVHRTARAGWLLCLRYNGPAGRRQTPSAFGHVLIAFLSRPAPALGPWSARPPGWRCRLSPGPARDAVCGVWRVAHMPEARGYHTYMSSSRGSLPNFLGCSLGPSPFASAIKCHQKSTAHATRLGRPLSVGSLAPSPGHPAAGRCGRVVPVLPLLLCTRPARARPSFGGQSPRTSSRGVLPGGPNTLSVSSVIHPRLSFVAHKSSSRQMGIRLLRAWCCCGRAARCTLERGDAPWFM
jgi:hypothetical protein